MKVLGSLAKGKYSLGARWLTFGDVRCWKTNSHKTYFQFEHKSKTGSIEKYWIKAVNDDWVDVHCRINEENICWQSHGGRPVLTVQVMSYCCPINLLVKANGPEASRSKQRKSKPNYAPQIFCQMLGQICYPEFYNNALSEYQEVHCFYGDTLADI